MGQTAAAGAGRDAGSVLTAGPATVYEAVTRQMVAGLEADLKEIKGRLDGLLFLVAGAIVVDLVLRLAG